jgi:HPt (histidine-containing phosphotransfer) domain-containing protein
MDATTVLELGPELDPQALARLSRLGGSDLVRRMLALFGEYGAARVGDAMAAGEAKDWAAVARAAHALRSSAGNVGASRLLSVATQLEAAAGARRYFAVTGLLRQLKAAFATACEQLRLLAPEQAA